jgi:hypothetical protein
VAEHPPPSPRYTFARAYPTDAAARKAWEAVVAAIRGAPASLSCTRLYLGDDRLVVLVASAPPPRPLRRLLERLLTDRGGAPYALDAGAADALHRRRHDQAPPPWMDARIEIVRPSKAEGLPLPYEPAGRPEPPEGSHQ